MKGYMSITDQEYLDLSTTIDRLKAENNILKKKVESLLEAQWALGYVYQAVRRSPMSEDPLHNGEKVVHFDEVDINVIEKSLVKK